MILANLILLQIQNARNVSYYICDEFTVKSQRNAITTLRYFGFPDDERYKNWLSKIHCNNCPRTSRAWFEESHNTHNLTWISSFSFAIWFEWFRAFISKAQLLGSRLIQWNLLDKNTTSYSRNMQEDSISYYTNMAVCCFVIILKDF